MCRSKSYNSQNNRFGRPSTRSWRITLAKSRPEAVRVLRRDGLTVCVTTHATRQRAILRNASRAHSKSNSRPEFARANFGIKFVSLDTGKVLYSLNSNKLFVQPPPQAVDRRHRARQARADYRFHTRIYRTAAVDKKGKLKGDLILVASGDPNLSNRIRPDGTLAFVDEDHSYNGPAVDGDPLTVIKQLAQQIAAKGIRKIEGRISSTLHYFPTARAKAAPTSLCLRSWSMTMSST